MYVLFLRENSGMPSAISPTASRRWLLNKQSAMAGREKVLRTLRKTPAGRSRCELQTEACKAMRIPMPRS